MKLHTVCNASNKQQQQKEKLQYKRGCHAIWLTNVKKKKKKLEIILTITFGEYVFLIYQFSKITIAKHWANSWLGV